MARQIGLFDPPPIKDRPLRVLVACEESQAVCKAFRELGHEAFSADLQECSGGHPEWHIQGDCLPIINGNCTFTTADTHTHTQAGPWDLLIAHPPCTYMSNAGAVRMYPESGKIDLERFKLAMDGKAFFMAFFAASCPWCIENPRPLSVVELPEPTQIIEPYEFGEPYSKLTCLWLHDLPPLIPTKILRDYKPYVSSGTSANKGNPDKAGVSRSGGASRVRSRTFPGIGKAMATQWSEYLTGGNYG